MQQLRINHSNQMRIRQFLICAIMLLLATSLYGNEAEEIRMKLPRMRGEARLEALSRLYDLSLESDDYQLQLKCLYDHLYEARRQGNVKNVCADLLTRALFFYNYDQNDSLFFYAREDLGYLSEHEDWYRFYRLWFSLANT